MRIIWWLLLGVLLGGFAVMDGFDLGTAALLPLSGRNDVERRIVINSVGPGMGRKSGLVHPGRRRDLRRLARALCRQLFRLLSGDVPGVGGADPASGGIQVPQQAGRSALAGLVGLGAVHRRHRAVAGVRRGIRQSVSRRAVRLRQPICGCIPTITLWSLLNPFALLCGLASLAMIVMHGAAWLNLQDRGPVQARARLALGFAAPSLRRAVCPGRTLGRPARRLSRSRSAIDPDGPSNPLGKAVDIVRPWLAGQFPAISRCSGCCRCGRCCSASGSQASTGRRLRAFLASALVPVLTIATAGAALFPFLLPSSVRARRQPDGLGRVVQQTDSGDHAGRGHSLSAHRTGLYRLGLSRDAGPGDRRANQPRQQNAY